MLSFDQSRTSNFHWDFKVDAKTVMEYIGQVLSWSRLCMLEGNPSSADDSFNGTEYWCNNVLIFDVLQEAWAAEDTLGFDGFGTKMLKAMETKVDVPEEEKKTEEWQQAYKVTWRLLGKACWQKVTHGKGLTHGVNLGELLDRKENADADCREGTFGELVSLTSFPQEFLGL
jgi:hypothetical protein